MTPSRPGCMLALLAAIVLLFGCALESIARPVGRAHAHAAAKRWRAGHHKAIVKGRGKNRVVGKKRARRGPAGSKPTAIVAPPSPASPANPATDSPIRPKPKPVVRPVKPIRVSRSELVARRIDAAIGHSREIVKMLKTGTVRGGVYLAYVPAKGTRPIPSKLICEIDLSSKDVIDEYYYSAGHLIFVRETVRNYPVDPKTNALDLQHPTYKEPVAIPFVRGHIAGTAKLRKRERSLLFDSQYLLTLLHAKGSTVDVEQWVKSPQI